MRCCVLVVVVSAWRVGALRAGGVGGGVRALALRRRVDGEPRRGVSVVGRGAAVVEEDVEGLSGEWASHVSAIHGAAGTPRAIRLLRRAMEASGGDAPDEAYAALVGAGLWGSLSTC